jgi:SAM-dependent methyltransferase
MPKVDMGKAWDEIAKDDSMYHFPRSSNPDEIVDWLQEAGDQLEAYTKDFFAAQGFSASGKRVLEIGCGPGRYTYWLSRMFADVTAIDVSNAMLAHAQEFNRGASNIRWLQVNGEDLHQCGDETFDFVFSSDVFKHVPSKEIVRNLFAETRRVLKPGGLFRIDFARYSQHYLRLAGIPLLPRRVFRFAPPWVLSPLQRLRCWVTRQPFRPMSVHPATLGVRFKQSELTSLIKGTGLELLAMEPDRFAYGAEWRVWYLGRRSRT